MRACKLAKDVLCQALALSATTRSCAAASPASTRTASRATRCSATTSTAACRSIFYPDNAIGSGGGAQTINDGQDAYGLTCTTGGGIPDIENHEGAGPGAVPLAPAASPNSGGPGQKRGGQSLDQAYAIHYSDGMAGPCFNACAQVPPHGCGGGYPGCGGHVLPGPRTRTSGELIDAGHRCRPMERLDGTHGARALASSRTSTSRAATSSSRTAGGGAGLGDPLLRDPREGRQGHHRRLRHPGPRQEGLRRGHHGRRAHARRRTATATPSARRSARERIGADTGEGADARRRSSASRSTRDERLLDVRVLRRGARPPPRATGASGAVLEQTGSPSATTSSR